MKDYLNQSGIVTEIQRFSVHDGPGIRSLVFFKGCPLRCRWCCNPENQRSEPETMTRKGRSEIVGERVTVAKIMETVSRDMIYYRRSGGGLTLSGGEVLAQPEFALSILRACKDKGINTAIETTGFARYEVIASLLSYLDLVMLDIKHISEDKHLNFTGQSNRIILVNAQKIGESGTPLIIRVPVVPTFNDTNKEIQIISLYAASIPGVKELHLLPYHRIGESKYEALGKVYSFKGIEPLTPERMKELLAIAQGSGLTCQIGG